MRVQAKWLVTQTRKQIGTAEFAVAARRHGRAFVRRRKLPLASVIVFVLGSKKKSLQLEIDEFVEVALPEGSTVGKDAMIKARQKVNYEAFQLLYEDIVSAIMEEDDLPKEGAYRLLAIDGSKTALPVTPDIEEHFGQRIEGHSRCSANLSCLCEESTGFVVDAALESYHTGERELAMRHLDKLKSYGGDHDVILFDRGYPSKELIHRLEENRQYYVMRVSKSFQAAIDAQTEPEGAIELTHRERTMTVRVLKIVLSTGVTETLISNLPAADFPHAAFADLYAKRWSIETQYDLLKNTMQLENFTGKTHLTVMQDFYALCYMTNLVVVIANEVDEELGEIARTHAYMSEHKANKQLIAGRLKHQFIKAVLVSDPETSGEILDRLVQRATQCYRVGSTSPPPPRSAQDTHHKKSAARKRAF